MKEIGDANLKSTHPNMQLDWMVACKLKCATSRPTSNSNHLSSTPHLPLRRISSGLSLNAQREWKVTLSCPVTALRSGKEPPSIFGHKSTKSCSKSDTWVGRGLAQDGRLGEPGGDHRPGWLKHLRLCCSSHGCNWRWPLEKTSMKKKRFLSGIARMRRGGGGSTNAWFFWPFFKKCIFGQQKESISSKMPMYRTFNCFLGCLLGCLKTTLFQKVHFWSIKRVFFLKNANVLNF